MMNNEDKNKAEDIKRTNKATVEKLKKGIYSIAQLLPLDEQRSFLKEWNNFNSFLKCGSINNITNQKTKQTIKTHTNRCGNKFCIYCTQNEMKVLLAKTLDLLKQEKDDYFFFPSTWTAENVPYEKLGEEIKKYRAFINRLRKQNDFETFVDDFIFKFEVTENQTRHEFNLHIHALFAVHSVLFNNHEKKISATLTKIQKDWKTQTGGYICVDDTYNGSKWTEKKTFNEVVKWIRYLYKPYWIAVGKTRHTKNTRQYIKTPEEYHQDFLKVSNVALAQAYVQLKGKQLMIKKGIFDRVQSSRSERQQNRTTDATNYDLAMRDDNYAYMIGNSGVESMEHAERRNRKLDIDRDNYNKKHGIKNKQNPTSSHNDIKREKQRILTEETFKELFNGKQKLIEKNKNKLLVAEETLLAEMEKFNALNVVECEQVYQVSYLRLKTKRGVKRAFSKPIIKKIYVPL